MNTTKMVPFSVGLVIEDNKGDYWLKVIPIELQGFVNGEITDGTATEEISGVDYRGEQWSSKYNLTTAVSAKWISNDSNRTTAPVVHKGERVQLYKFSDTDEIFWSDMGQTTNERSTERMVTSWSNKEKRDGKELDHTNAYFFEVDTKTGLVTFKTNKNQNEPFEYTIQINTKEGFVVIEDDTDNCIYIKSKEKECTMKNASGSIIQAKGGEINLNAGKINITGSIVMKGDTKLQGGFSTTGEFTNNGKNVGSGHIHNAYRGNTSPPL